MSEKKEIYARLGEMIGQCIEKVKVCTPCTDYYSRSSDWSEDTMYVINAHQLQQLLEDEAAKEE
jgi:hypothetical protein